ncbi:rhomboid family intramembrane serine protease [Anoxybacillus flavithermus]
MIYRLIIFGPPLERIYGSAKFTFLFFVTGMVGGLFILIFSDNVIVAGASGSLFGLMGLYLGLIIKRNKIIDSESKSVIWIAFVGNIIYTFAAPNISISAHLGGLFSGIFLSFFVRPQSFRSLLQNKWSLSVFQTLVVTLLWFSILSFPKYFLHPSTISELAAKLKVQSVEMNKSGNSNISSSRNDSRQISETQNKVSQNETVNEPSIKILHIRSGVMEGWIDTRDSFFDELVLTIQVKNGSEETIDIYPEMFILSDTAGYTPSLMENDGQYFENIPLPPMQQVTFDLAFAVSLKQTTGQFLLSVSGWNSYERFKIDYEKFISGK